MGVVELEKILPLSRIDRRPSSSALYMNTKYCDGFHLAHQNIKNDFWNAVCLTVLRMYVRLGNASKDGRCSQVTRAFGRCLLNTNTAAPKLGAFQTGPEKQNDDFSKTALPNFI
jgi:hypothetical protein